MGSVGKSGRVDRDDLGVPTPPRGDSVLLLASSMERPPAPDCVTLNGATATDGNVVTMALDGSVRGVIDEWTTDAGELPARLAVVTVGEAQRSAAATDGGNGGPAPLPGNVSTASVSTPGDLTGLGIKLSQCLSSWSGDGNETAVEVDSLTTLLQFAELKRVFQFVHVLTGRIDSAGAVGFFHLDPSAHGDQTVATLRGVFDTVYEYGADGWEPA